MSVVQQIGLTAGCAFVSGCAGYTVGGAGYCEAGWLTQTEGVGQELSRMAGGGAFVGGEVE